MKLLKFVLLNTVAVGLGAVVATSCIGVEYPTVAFRCNPRQSDNCPEEHFCCSDDPAAVGGGLPDYADKDIPGGKTPYFSGVNNGLGTSGLCVRLSDIPVGAGLVDPGALNCPIPCNPTWTNSDIADVCGGGRQCCQTVEITEADCVQDSDGTWRPATGNDISRGLTNWSPGRHDTHQDPNGIGCEQFAAGDMTIFNECVAELTVANQRGFCMSLQPGQYCPTSLDTFIDACERLNGGPGGSPDGDDGDDGGTDDTGTGTS